MITAIVLLACALLFLVLAALEVQRRNNVRLKYLKRCVEHLAGIAPRQHGAPPPNPPWMDCGYPPPWDR